jgi:predicted nucleic acid-binding Zn ribbon protein
MKRKNAVRLGDVLEDFFARPYVAAKVAEGKLPDTWREVVGERVASLTSSLRLENRVLYVNITSSVVRYELFCRRTTLRDEINRISGLKLVNTVIIK